MNSSTDHRKTHKPHLVRGWLLRAALLLALLVQGTIVQTHIDFARAPVSASAAGSLQLTSVAKGDASGDPALCPLCQEAAMAGHYFTPAAGALPAAPAIPQWTVPGAALAFDLAQPALGWLSRAPPQ
jgi:hypothetical protein